MKEKGLGRPEGPEARCLHPPMSCWASSPKMEPSFTTEGEAGLELSWPRAAVVCLGPERGLSSTWGRRALWAMPVAMPFEMANEISRLMLSGRSSSSVGPKPEWALATRMKEKYAEFLYNFAVPTYSYSEVRKNYLKHSHYFLPCARKTSDLTTHFPWLPNCLNIVYNHNCQQIIRNAYCSV